MIKATHDDGRTTTFTQKSWDLLGKNKGGWKMTNPEPPEEVKEALNTEQITANPEPPEEVKEAPKKGGKK